MSITTGKREPGLALSRPPAIRILFCLQCNTSPASFMHFWTSCKKAKKQYAVDESHERRQAFLEVDALLDHLFRHLRRVVTSNLLPFYIRSVVVAFRCGVYDGKLNSGSYGNLSAIAAFNLLLSEARSSGVHTNTVTPSVITW